MEKSKTAFVAASITHGRETLPFVRFIIGLLQYHGYDVPSVHNAADDPVKVFVEKIGDPTATDPASFYEWNNRWIEEADIFVAEMSIPSDGRGAEFERCILKPRLGLSQTPILGVYLEGSRVSPHILGAGQKKTHIWFRSYREISDLRIALEDFLVAFS